MTKNTEAIFFKGGNEIIIFFVLPVEVEILKGGLDLTNLLFV